MIKMAAMFVILIIGFSTGETMFPPCAPFFFV
jgi:hypothetical protein